MVARSTQHVFEIRDGNTMNASVLNLRVTRVALFNNFKKERSFLWKKSEVKLFMRGSNSEISDLRACLII